MRVLRQLDRDLVNYGYNQFVVTDTDTNFSIRRVHPILSNIEIEQIMEREYNDF